MTTLTFQFSRAIGRILRPGDEVVITRLDHDANRAPWLALQEQGVTVREVDFDPQDCTLLVERSALGEHPQHWGPGGLPGAALADLLSPRTRLVAVGFASNAVGTINPIRQIAEMAHSVGAWLWVDAVHYAPHGPIDVKELGCDFLVCSPYKFFGPHSGVAWGRYALLEELHAYKVRPAGNLPPDKFETGTQSHEAQAGVLAAIEYLAELGKVYGNDYTANFPGLQGRRLALKQGMAAIRDHERPMFTRFVSGLSAIPGLKLYGITDPARFDRRTPTAAFRLAHRSPDEVAEYLARHGIYVWAGNFYAITVTEQLDLEASGGVVRAGLVHYNTPEEVDYFLARLEDLA
jgi:cysteine desulfurase family protein (TIGR01976 family)